MIDAEERLQHRSRGTTEFNDDAVVILALMGGGRRISNSEVAAYKQSNTNRHSLSLTG